MMDKDQSWPVTSGQEGIWVGSQIAGRSNVYHTAEYVEIVGPLDRGRLRRVITQRLEAWPSLRPAFEAVGACHEEPEESAKREPLLKVKAAPIGDKVLPQVDVSEHRQPRVAALAQINALREEIIDVTKSAAVKFCLIRLGSHGHFLAIISHHITLDGYSYGLLVKQLIADYNALAAGSPLELAAPSEPFAQLAKERSDYENSEDFATDLAFWQQELEGFAGHGRASPSTFSETIRRIKLPVPSTYRERIEELCRNHGCHWSLFWLAAGFLVTYRQTGQRDIVLGVPLMPRMGSAALRIPSMTMNIIPLRLKIRSDDSLVSVMARLKPKLAECSRHGRFRSEQLRRQLPGMSPSVRLFARVLNIMPFDYATVDFAGCFSECFTIASGPVEDSSIMITKRNGVLAVTVEHNGANYSEEQAKQLATEFRQEWRSLLEVPTLSFAEREGYLSVSAAPVIEQRITDVMELIAVHRGKDKLALVAGDEELHYSDLLARARICAAHLKAQGLHQGDVVYTGFDRSAAAIIALLGCHLAGVTFVPLAPGVPQRNAQIMAQCPAKALVASDSFLASFDYPPGEVIAIDAFYAREAKKGWVETGSGGDEIPLIPAETDAYILFTSGSTGEPKGVRVSRGSLAAFAYGGGLAYELSSSDRMLQFAPFHFDTIIEEVFCTLSVGAAVVLRNDEMLESPAQFFSFIEAKRVSVADLPTAYWHELCAYLAADASHRKAVPFCLRKMIIGGEYAQPDAICKWRRQTQVTLYNSYGPTEATVVATVCKVTDDAQAQSIGVPLPGRTIAILDDQLEPVPMGVKGQIAIGGVLATGYLGDDQNARFRDIPLPHYDKPQRLYLTGDYGIMAAGLQFAGRMDDEIKISGYRIQPTEIGRALQEVPGVSECEVLSYQDAEGTPRLGAFVVAASLTVAEVKDQLKQRLPEVMVPGQMTILAQLPTNAQGKVDRKALLATLAASAKSAGRSELVGDDDGVGAAVSEIWAQLLGHRSFGSEDDFFAVGGTSLGAIQLANRLSLAFNAPCPVSLVFDRPKFADQVQAFAEADAYAGASPGSSRGDVTGIKAQLSRDIASEIKRLDQLSQGNPPTATSEGWQVLTGATGFVGLHILSKLVQQSTQPVVCLSRGASHKEARDRLEAKWQETFSRMPFPDDRVQVICADLERPGLGLAAGDRQKLLSNTSAIIHCAAKVRVMQSYEALKAANLFATTELLAIAAKTSAPLVYVSTVSVAPDVQGSGRSVFYSYHEGLKDGYQQSKWAGEMMVKAAIDRGVKAQVLRVGRVCPAIEQPLVNPDDLFWQIAASCIRLNCYPETAIQEPWLPVDHFAASVAGMLTQAGTPADGVIDAIPDKPTDVAALLGRLHSFGYPLTAIPHNEWLIRLATSEAPEDAQLYHIVAGRKPRPAAAASAPPNEAYRELLATLGQQMVTIDEAIFAAMVVSAQQAHILPSPGSA